MEGYIKKRNKYSHLSSEERGKIEAYWHQGVSISRIAYFLKRSKSTISEELRRGRYNERYTAEISHKHTKDHTAAKTKALSRTEIRSCGNF